LEARVSFITLGVADLARSTRFYCEVLGLTPRPSSMAQVSFFDMGDLCLALYSRAQLAADAGISDEDAGFAGISLSHNVISVEQVDALLAHVDRHADEFGGRVTRAGRTADWGGYTGYFSDPDGFLWEVVWNPHG
jgi:catechol 2,3-dioxygenase-like lactoylglutathione lyase family enzyme